MQKLTLLGATAKYAQINKIGLKDMTKQSQEVSDVKAYKMFYYECECPHCEAVVRVADDDGVSGARFNQECTECRKSFSAYCE